MSASDGPGIEGSGDDAPPLSCRDLDAIDEDVWCSACHAEERRGAHRLRTLVLADGRRVRVCHAAEKALREEGRMEGGGGPR